MKAFICFAVFKDGATLEGHHNADELVEALNILKNSENPPEEIHIYERVDVLERKTTWHSSNQNKAVVVDELVEFVRAEKT